MAIKISLSRFGIDIPNAVVKVVRICGSKETGWTADMGVFSKAGESKPIEVFSVEFDNVSGEHPYASAYNKTKALAEFTTGEDV